MPTGHSFMLFVVCWFFFQNQLFRKNITGKQSYCQTLFVGPHLGPYCLLRVKKAKIFTWNKNEKWYKKASRRVNQSVGGKQPVKAQAGFSLEEAQGTHFLNLIQPCILEMLQLYWCLEGSDRLPYGRVTWGQHCFNILILIKRPPQFTGFVENKYRH